MTNNKQKSQLERLKCTCLHLLLKTFLYILGFSLVLIIIISAIPSLLIYSFLGEYNMNKQIDKEYKLSENHFNE